MSDALFWFDQKDANPDLAANGDPKKVITAFDGNLGGKGLTKAQLSPDLWNMWQKPLAHVEFRPNFALYMRGTTGDLVEALQRDINAGIHHVAVINDDVLEIRYFRQKAGMDKKVSIIGIAGSDYWGKVPVHPYEKAKDIKTWALLRSYKHVMDEDYREAMEQYQDLDIPNPNPKPPKMFVSMDLTHLRDTIKTLRGQKTWM